MAFLAAAPALYAAIASAVVTTATTVISSQQQAKSLEAQADYQEQQTKVQVNAMRRENQKVLAKQEAISSASGLDATVGSPLELATETAYTGELNALMAKQAGMYEAKSLRYKASNTRQAGIFNAFSSAIGSSGTMLGSFMKA